MTVGNWARGKQGFQETARSESDVSLAPEPVIETDAERYAAEIPKLSAAMAKARAQGTPEGNERQVKIARAIIAAEALSRHDEARGIIFSKFKSDFDGQVSIFVAEVLDGDGQPIGESDDDWGPGANIQDHLIRGLQDKIDNMNISAERLDEFADEGEHMQTWMMLTEGRQAARENDIIKEL